MRLSRRNRRFTALLSKGLSTALSHDVRAEATCTGCAASTKWRKRRRCLWKENCSAARACPKAPLPHSTPRQRKSAAASGGASSEKGPSGRVGRACPSDACMVCGWTLQTPGSELPLGAHPHAPRKAPQPARRVRMFMGWPSAGCGGQGRAMRRQCRQSCRQSTH